MNNNSTAFINLSFVNIVLYYGINVLLKSNVVLVNALWINMNKQWMTVF